MVAAVVDFVTSLFSPRDYQHEAYSETQRALLQDRDCVPLIDLPTGSGKSWVIAMLTAWAVGLGGRVLVLANRKELLKQNGEKIEQLIDQKVGYVSSGLRRWDYKHQVVCAGVQTLYRCVEKVGDINLIIIDEAHLISPENNSMFRVIIEAFDQARSIGLTATSYRTDGGSIVDNGIFTQIVYRANVRELINKGYLSRLTTKPTSVSISSKGLRSSRGEYLASQQEDIFLGRLTETCKEIVSATADRKTILVFCITVAHAEAVRAELESLTGERIGLLTGHTIPLERLSILNDFQAGKIRFLVNIAVLTTGYDNPRIDAICILRCTKSPGLNAQICGRGFRVAEGKEDCLILDFGKNIERHGPLDSKWYGQMENRRGGGEAPLKICPNCEAINHAAVKVCEDCGHQFVSKETIEPNHDSKFDENASILTNGKESKASEYFVEEISYRKHVKRGAVPESVSVCCNYLVTDCDGGAGNLFLAKMISEYVCFEHTGYARSKAEQWWRVRSSAPVPDTVDEALNLINRHLIRPPSHITAKQEGRFHRIVSVEFSDPKPEPAEWQQTPYRVEHTPF